MSISSDFLLLSVTTCCRYWSHYDWVGKYSRWHACNYDR